MVLFTLLASSSDAMESTTSAQTLPSLTKEVPVLSPQMGDIFLFPAEPLIPALTGAPTAALVPELPEAEAEAKVAAPTTSPVAIAPPTEAPVVVESPAVPTEAPSLSPAEVAVEATPVPAASESSPLAPNDSVSPTPEAEASIVLVPPSASPGIS